MRRIISALFLGSILFASLQAQGPVLAWDHVGGAETFRVQVDDAQTFSIPVPANTSGRYFWPVPDVARTARQFVVSACNSFGLCSDPKTISVAPPIPVTNLAAQDKIGVLGTGLPAGSVSTGDIVTPPADIPPPDVPSNLFPAHGATDVSQDPTLSFVATGGETYAIYFDDVSPPTNKFVLPVGPTFQPGSLPLSALRYWQAEACNVNPATMLQQCTLGPIVSFTTSSPGPAPSNILYLSPSNGQTAVSINPTLNCSANDADTFYILTGTSNPPTSKTNLGGACSHPMSALPYETLHYWQICATNVIDTLCGSIVSFTTMVDPGPPVDPNPDCESDTPSATGEDHFLYDPCGQDKMNTMKADYEANTSAPATLGGRFYKFVKFQADRTETTSQQNADIGQWAAFMVAAGGCASMQSSPGTLSYAEAANKRLDEHYDAREAPGYGPAPYDFARQITNKNDVREYTMTSIQVAAIIKPCITGPQYERLKVGIAQQIQAGLLGMVIGSNTHYLNIHDSDNTIGEYFHAIVHGLVEPTYQLAIDNFSNVNVPQPQNGGMLGGLDPTQTPQEYIADTAATNRTARNAIQMFVEYLSEDGTWMEGNHYDLGTIQILLEGYLTVKRLTGVDHYPEITAWLPKHARFLMQQTTPDLQRIHAHGDLASPRSPLRAHYTGVLMLMAAALEGTTEGQQLQDLIIEMEAQWGTTGTTGVQPSAQSHVPFFFYNPEMAATEWRDGTLSHTDRYIRMALRKNHATNTTASQYYFDCLGPQRWNAALNKTVSVQHPDNLPGWCTWDLYANGEWKVTDVKFNTLRAGADGGNTVVVHGRSRQSNSAYVNFWEPTDHANYFAVAATTGGAKGFNITCSTSAPPDIFLHEKTRRQVYVPSVSGTQLVFTHDRVSALTTIPQGSTCYSAAEQNRVAGFNAFGHVLLVNHTQTLPVKSGNAFTFTSPLGTSMKMTLANESNITSTIVNEVTETSYYSFGWNSAGAERKWHIRNTRTTPAQWNTLLTVHEILPSGGSFGTVTELADAGKAEGLHVTRTGEADVVVAFNSEQGADLTPSTGPDTSHDEQLEVVRFRETGFALNWTSVASTTYVILNDLNPANTWTYTINGGASTPITEDAAGNAYIELSGAGAKALVVTGI